MDVDGFRRRIVIDESGCHLWTGARTKNGYGNLWNGERNEYAHRFSWRLAAGRDVPEGMMVLHQCDVPACVNPDHLFLGTHRDNVEDMLSKGRQTKVDAAGVEERRRRATGTLNQRAKLTEAQARWVLARKGTATARAIAANGGLPFYAVRHILCGESWGHING